MLIPKHKIHILVFIIEALALVLSFAFAFLWIKHSNEHYDAYFTLTSVTFLVTEFYRRYEGKIINTEGMGRTQSEKLHHAEALRPKFEAEILRCKKENLRKDVIIRHVNRADEYPQIKEGKGISSWFRLGLLGTYHGGILVGLGWEGLVECPNGFRSPNYKINENAGFNAMLMGEIPYDSIELMKVDGDEFYSFPHIYCHFENNGQPYKRLYYAQEEEFGHGRKYWREIATYVEVKENTKNWG